MRGIISYFIKYPVAANVILLLILIFGALAATNLKSTFFPEFDPRLIVINVVYPGASPEEIEEGVVLKIEDNLKGITGVERVISKSTENTALIQIELLKGSDGDQALEDVQNAVNTINSFPGDMEPPIIYKQQIINFAASFAIKGNTDLGTLKTYAEGVEKDLRAVDGISQIEISGYPEEEIEVSVRESDLRAYGLSFQQVAMAVSSSNVRITGGTIKGDKEELLIRANLKDYYAEGLENIVVKTNADGSMVYLKDVGRVVNQWADDPAKSYVDDQRAVIITINKTTEEDIIYITNYIEKYIEDFNANNDIVKAEMIRDGSEYLIQRLNLLIKNGLIGAVLVVIILSLFLDIYLSFWVAIALPVSFCGMFIMAAFLGLTINVISLFGMILVVGILVDDGIVIAENIYQQWENGSNPLKSAINGTLEVLPSVFSAIATTVVAFATFYFLDGRIGDFISDMAFVVIWTLIISLIEGALILPTHVAHSRALKKDDGKHSMVLRTINGVRSRMDAFMDWMKNRLYVPVLKAAVHMKAITVAVIIFLLLTTVGAINGGLVQTTFFPFIDFDNIAINLSLAAGTRESETEAVLNMIEEKIWIVNEDFKNKREDGKNVILRVEKHVGPGSNQGRLNIILLDAETRVQPSYFTTSAIRDSVGKIYGVETLTYGVQSNFGKPVSVSLLGNNLDELTSAKNELLAELQKLSSLRDITDNDQEGIREVSISLKDKAYALGLTPLDIIAQIRQGFFGYEAQRLQRGEDEVKVWVRYDEIDRNNTGKLEDMYIRTMDGRNFPLQELATFEMSRGISSIDHLYGQREMKIEADLANPEDPVPVILEDIQLNILPDILAKYPTVRASFEGQQRENNKTAESGQTVLPIILILMFTIVVLTFRSFGQAGIVFLTIPFGLVGVAFGHYLHGKPISMLSIFGTIALIGVMINDSLVFINAFNIRMKNGDDFMTAIIETGKSRFRPIVLTSLTTIGGLGPLILEKSFQAQFLVPMAIALAYGLGFATMLTLIVVPVLLVIKNDFTYYFKWAWDGIKPSREEVEPAVEEMAFERFDEE